MVSTPQISGLATRLAAPARLLAARWRQGTRPEAAPAPATDDFAARVQVPRLAVSPQDAACAALRQTHSALAREDRWSQLLDALTRADQARTVAPGGRRLAALISQGARADLTAALARNDWHAALAEVDRLETALAPHVDTPMAAHLVAQARLDLGWARRASAPAAAVPRDVWQIFLQQTALAEAALEPFDPIEEMSPLLAETRYQLVRGIEEGDALFRDWYEDWSDLDMTSPDAHMAHAVMLLPPWFGAVAAFDAEARRAMRRTEHVSGAAAYAAFCMAASDHLGSLPAGMDLPLFLAGLKDHHRATGCQHRANTVAAAMTELLHAQSIDAPGSVRFRLVRDALTEHLTGHLREFHLPAWENGETCIRFALEQVFGPELARGADIHAGPNGLTTHRPA